MRRKNKQKKEGELREKTYEGKMTKMVEQKNCYQFREGCWYCAPSHANGLWEQPVVFCYVGDVINMTIAHSISTCQTGRRGHSIKHVIRFTSSGFVFCFDEMRALYSSCNELRLFFFNHCQLDLSVCSEVYE
jgi:hypothetical protein